MLSKYAWLISTEKISFVRTCCGSNKSDGLHNKGPHTRGNIKWRSFALRFCASTLNAHDNLCFPLRRAYLLLLCKNQSFLSLFLLFLSFGKHHVVRKDLGTYVQLNMGTWVIIVDITLEVNTLGCETISPHLSMCPVEMFCSCVCGEC